MSGLLSFPTHIMVFTSVRSGKKPVSQGSFIHCCFQCQEQTWLKLPYLIRIRKLSCVLAFKVQQTSSKTEAADSPNEKLRQRVTSWLTPERNSSGVNEPEQHLHFKLHWEKILPHFPSPPAAIKYVFPRESAGTTGADGCQFRLKSFSSSLFEETLMGINVLVTFLHWMTLGSNIQQTVEASCVRAELQVGRPELQRRRPDRIISPPCFLSLAVSALLPQGN